MSGSTAPKPIRTVRRLEARHFNVLRTEHAGLDFPVDSLSSSYEALIRLYKNQIPRAAHDKVFGRNAQRFYRF